MYNVRLTDHDRYAVYDENARSVFLFGTGILVEGSMSIHSIHVKMGDAFDKAIELNRQESEYFNTQIDRSLEWIDNDIETIEDEIKQCEKKLEILKLAKIMKLRKVRI